MRLLHTMLRVKDLDQTICFYEKNFNMRVLRKKKYPKGQFTLVFIGFSNENDETVLEFTYNWGVDNYDIGTAFGHIAFSVEDINHTCDFIRNNGGVILREPGPMKFGGSILAFVEDPNGYKIELLER